MVFAKPVIKFGDSWNLELRTIETSATILYNSGSTQDNNTRPDFMSLEIIESKLRLLVGKGANAVELISEKSVSDGKWHNISVSYNPRNVDIIVDDLVRSANFANGSSQVIELGEEFFIGGIEISRRKKALAKGVRAAEISFEGCLRNLMIEKQQIGFPNMKITQGVTVDCVWKYPCIEKQPCIASGQCHQYGFDEFVCYCDQAYCLKADYTERYKIFTRSDLPIEEEILGITPLQILESDSIFLSPNFIDVLFDYSKKGILESEVIFQIVQPPRHGKISIISSSDDLNNTQTKFFSLIDLSTDKVKYTHNGMEQFNDHMVIDLQLISKLIENLPELKGKHRFVLHANITPVNDAPLLNIPNNKILRLTQGIPKIIGPDLLTADDPDSIPTSLIYTILSSPTSDGQHGKIEVGGKSVSTFSQSDINEGLVSYLVNTQSSEDTSFEISIQVSDGMETSPGVILGVSVLPLQLTMINNTGLILVHKSSAVITPWNLSFISNSEEENVDVNFEIVQPPHYGSIQKLRSVDSSWISVDSFTSSQLVLGQIRYLHITEFPVHDEFKVSFLPFFLLVSSD